MLVEARKNSGPKAIQQKKQYFKRDLILTRSKAINQLNMDHATGDWKVVPEKERDEDRQTFLLVTWSGSSNRKLYLCSNSSCSAKVRSSSWRSTSSWSSSSSSSSTSSSYWKYNRNVQAKEKDKFAPKRNNFLFHDRRAWIFYWVWKLIKNRTKQTEAAWTKADSSCVWEVNLWPKCQGFRSISHNPPFYSLFSFLSFNQWCILNQVPRGGATLLVFNFPINS